MNNRTQSFKFGITGIGIVLYSLMFCTTLAYAETLTGTVNSQKEGTMEGVLVSAKKQSGTITITVVSNAEGQYNFPADRLSPGTYDITIRAVGYKLPVTGFEVSAGKTARLDLKLDEVTSKMQLASQLSNTESAQC